MDTGDAQISHNFSWWSIYLENFMKFQIELSIVNRIYQTTVATERNKDQHPVLGRTSYRFSMRFPIFGCPLVPQKTHIDLYGNPLFVGLDNFRRKPVDFHIYVNLLEVVCVKCMCIYIYIYIHTCILVIHHTISLFPKKSHSLRNQGSIGNFHIIGAYNGCV